MCLMVNGARESPGHVPGEASGQHQLDALTHSILSRSLLEALLSASPFYR